MEREKIPQSGIVKTNVPYILKDMNSGALINTNRAKLEAVKARKKSMERLDRVEQQVANLHAVMKDNTCQLERIAELLNKVVDRNA